MRERKRTTERFPRLADRLAVAGGRRLWGREHELALFRDALTGGSAPFSLLYVHGLGGVGKSALLNAAAQHAAAGGVMTVSLDARHMEATPRGFLHAVAEALGVEHADAALDRIGREESIVLTLDSVDALAAIEPWLRQKFLPMLPAQGIVMMAGRVPPSADWTADPALGPIFHALPLRNLPPEESRALLCDRHVPEYQHDAVLAFTHGHPLALVLVADVISHSGSDLQFTPECAPNLVRELLTRLIATVPSSRASAGARSVRAGACHHGSAAWRGARRPRSRRPLRLAARPLVHRAERRRSLSRTTSRATCSTPISAGATRTAISRCTGGCGAICGTSWWPRVGARANASSSTSSICIAPARPASAITTMRRSDNLRRRGGTARSRRDPRYACGFAKARSRPESPNTGSTGSRRRFTCRADPTSHAGAGREHRVVRRVAERRPDRPRCTRPVGVRTRARASAAGRGDRPPPLPHVARPLPAAVAEYQSAGRPSHVRAARAQTPRLEFRDVCGS